MAYTAPEDVADDVIGAISKWYKTGAYTQLAQKFQRYPFYGLLLEEERLVFDSGMGIKHTLMTSLGDTAKWVGLFEGRDVKIKDLFAQMDLGYKFINNPWAYDYKETWLNAPPEQRANVIKARDEACALGLIQQVETTAWKKPDSGAPEEMFPVAFWVVWDSTTPGGHNGKYPTGFTKHAGVDLDKHENVRNWADTWTNPTTDDLLAKLREAHTKTNFISPLDAQEFRGKIGKDYRMFSDFIGMKALWEMADNRNDRTGWDIGQQDNQMTFRGNQVVYTPPLDSSPVLNNPFYGINRGAFHVVCDSAEFMRTTKPMNDSTNPDTYVAWKSAMIQSFCEERRAQFVVAKSAA